MRGVVSQGVEDADVRGPAAFLVRQALTLGLIAVIVLVYRYAGVAGSLLAGQSAFALAILVPMATMNRTGLLGLRPAPSTEAHVPAMATEISAS